MAKEILKNKMDGNELDLSLLNLDEVPVKEIASLVKATHVDLSCNRILNIPSSFCGLQQIVKLDLSKNHIETLPFNFGDLTKLQYLDLYNNRIMMLPISFGQLRSLKWLDLKGNPLDPQLKAIAGDCLDAKQCQNCAKRVVNFMQKVEEQFLIEEQQNERNQLREVEVKTKVEVIKRERQTTKRVTTTIEKISSEGRQPSQTVTWQSTPERQNRTEKRNRNSQNKSRVVSNELQTQQNGKKKTNEKKQTTKTQRLNSSSSSSTASECWRFLSRVLAASFLLSSTLAAVLFYYTGGGVSSEAVWNAIPNIADDVAKLTNATRTKLFDCIDWMDTDGRKVVSWMLENGLILLKDFSEVLILSCDHVEEILENLIESSSTITMTTTNAKQM